MIRFYHLENEPVEHALAELLSRADDHDLRTLTRVENDEMLKRLDTALWQNEDHLFLAHGTDKDKFPEHQPHFLTTKDDSPNEAKVLLIVNDAGWKDMDYFDRIFYLFEGRFPSSLEGAREQWKALKSKGYSPEYWQQTDAGKWQKKHV